jgi:hypothetical protein
MNSMPLMRLETSYRERELAHGEKYPWASIYKITCMVWHPINGAMHHALHSLAVTFTSKRSSKKAYTWIIYKVQYSMLAYNKFNHLALEASFSYLRNHR